MNVLHIEDQGDGKFHFMWQRGNSSQRPYRYPIPVSNPLSLEEREELRWYLEDYLTYPYGFEFRAKKVEEKMAQWGESLFKMVFIKSEEDPDPRGMYQEAVREGLENCELCISSDDPSFLNIPWELIRDPTPGRGYLAPSLSGLYRQRIGSKIEVPKSPYSDDQLFKILLVIPRPKGEKDVPYGTVSRPIVEALRPLRSKIKLDVLRIPTFEAFVEKLNKKPGYYDLVHFDGHGSFERGAPNGDSMRYGFMENYGCLVFEKDDGCHFVNSKDLGQALAKAKVPLFVLNACQSAVEGEKEAFSSVASQLIAVGAKGVVAMGYSVYADAAAQFIKKFYENLVDGKSLSEAVAAGRLSLFTNSFRNSMVGKMEFSDWMVPTLYQQEQNYIPIPSGISVVSSPNQKEKDLRQQAEMACPEGCFGFIGRDNDILRIERELWDNNRPWILLSGMGGTGKTELAYGFARWYAETGGCDGGVFETSFKSKSDFGQIVGSIVGHATDFSKYTYDEQFQILVKYLRENPCLLIWDNFESVSGYPQGTEPIASPDEMAIISRFLKSLKGGKSRVIITTRKDNEDWLGIAPSSVHITGMNFRDRAELAKIILKTIGRKPDDFRDDNNYGELLKLLNGHPRSLEVVLPLLKKKSPNEIIKALQYEVSDLGEKIEDVSLSYAFSQLSPMAKKHLPLLGLFSSRVNPQILTVFVGNEGFGKTTYEKVVGETLSPECWEAVLEEAATNGLVESKDGTYYELHPTLPSFFRKQLVTNLGDEGLNTLNAEFVSFYSAVSSSILEGIRKSELSAINIFMIEEPNFLRALRSAEISEDWVSIDSISKVILEFYENIGRIAESNTLRTHLLAHFNQELTSEDSKEKAYSWMYLLGQEANYRISINRLEEAASLYTQILKYLISLKDPTAENNIAAAYHQLGMIAQERQRFDEAEKWYRKSLEIKERLGLERNATSDYHQLGMIAQERQRFDEAEKWYRKSLEIFERLGIERNAADVYHQLGRVEEERQRFDEAEKWYIKSLEIFERLGLERDAAGEYHQLGRVAEERQRLDEAEKWYRKSLEIFERLGIERNAADVYHQLGRVAQERQRFDEAEKWYIKSLDICDRLGLEREVSTDFHQLGMIAQERQRFDEAEKWYIKSLDICNRLGLKRNTSIGYHQLGMIAQERQRFDEAEKWYKKALEIIEPLEHPPLQVNTLAQLGVLYRGQNRFEEAVSYFGRALTIAVNFKMNVGRQIFVDLSRTMKVMGREVFKESWVKEFGEQENMIELFEDNLRKMEESDQ